MGSVTSPPRRHRRASWRTSAVALGVTLAAFGLGEAYLHLRPPASEGFTRYTFHSRLSASRWAYLAAERDELLLERILEENVRPGLDHVEEPEPGRPPFDRVARPFHVHTNDLGFRDGRFHPDKPSGVVRILVLGDSITWGKGVEEEHRYSDLLGESLPGGVEIFNLGFEGATTDCVAEVLGRFVAYRPDLVVVQAPGNDVDQALWRIAEQKRLHALSVWMQQIVVRSRLLLAARYLLLDDTFDAQIEEAQRMARQVYAIELDEIFRLGRTEGFGIVVLSMPLAHGHRYGAHVAEECLARPADCLGVVDVDFAEPGDAIADWPSIRDDLVIQEDFVDRTAVAMGFDATALGATFPHRHLFTDIAHPNEQGHAVIAHELAAFLRPRLPPAGADPGSGAVPQDGPAAAK
jgi:lysophospholipase L1-like esterase